MKLSNCEHGSEDFGSIKDWEFLAHLTILSASQECLCSMELVRNLLSWRLFDADFMVKYVIKT